MEKHSSKLQFSDEEACDDGNVGAESAQMAEEAVETGVRRIESAHRSHSRRFSRQQEAKKPHFSSTAYARWQQKQTVKREYAAASKAAEKSAKEAKKTASFFVRHKKAFLLLLGLVLLAIFLLNVASSCSVLVQSGLSAIGASTYPSADSDMLAAEAQYCAMEEALQAYLDGYEDTHDYDEYRFDLDPVGHDPYVLISAMTALHGGPWTIDEVGDILQQLFDKQYLLTETVTTETRPDPENPSEACVYTICTVELENFDLSHVPVYLMSEEQLSMYAMYMGVLGNRPDLFPDSGYIGIHIDQEYEDYEIPQEALEDETFAAMMEEAEKFLGYPYVWGGSSPSTSFDCSGFVSWVINHSGWDVGRLGAEGLRNICTGVSTVNAKPGDLVFFQGTYDTPGASHVGIYVGNQTMIHCGDPIQYAKIDTDYWQAHFMQFGRLPSP